jgi:hypothetical protein
MGFNTPILVLNDALGQIGDNPEEFTEAVISMAKNREPTVESVGNHVNPVSSVGAAHADQLRILYSKGNRMVDLNQARFSLDEYDEQEKQRLRSKAEHVRDQMERLLEELDGA